MAQKKNRRIDGIVVHCTATRPSVFCNVEKIDEMHKARGFSKQSGSGHYCGYHFVIQKDGGIEAGRYLDEIGAHVKGYNAHTIGVCYVGGLDDNGKPADTRTLAQKQSLVWLIKLLKTYYPRTTVHGHRDYSPDTNKNGKVDTWEYIKACPCFNASTEYSEEELAKY